MFEIFIKSILTVFIVMMLFSCENSISEVQEITKLDSLPSISAQNIIYERTDSGHLQMVLRSPIMNRYEGEDPYDVFPEGFEVTFYDTTAKEVSYIKANYGISYSKKKIMTARNDVVVVNYEKEEQLNTENLVWDQKKKMIYANTFVKITAPDKVVYGDSLRAHESFKSREIFNMRGVFEVEDDTDTIN